MKRFSEQFKKKSESIRLRASERSDLRARLESYMEYHPLPSEMKAVSKAPTKKQMEGIISEPFKAIAINMTYVRSFAGVFAVFLVVGVPIVAERSVPGDMLYPVKTEITEELRSSLKLSPYAKVEWETKRLERRVAEARLLASEGKLTPETEAVVALAVQEHTDAVNSEIATIREDDEDDAAMAEIAFASALSVQADVLGGYVENDTDEEGDTGEGHSVSAIVDAVNEISNEANLAQADSEPSYEALLGSVELETTRAYELFESIQTHAVDTEIVDIKRRLADVERKLVQAISLQSDEAPFVDQTTQETLADVVTEVQPAVNQSATSDDEVVGTDIQTEDIVEAEVLVTEVDTENLATSSDSGITNEDTQEEIILDDAVSQEERTAEAIALLRVALTDVQKLIIFMTDINVRENIAIDELVPVTFTGEERTDKVLEQLDAVLAIQAIIVDKVLTDEYFEKATTGQDMLAVLATSVGEYLSEGDIDAAETAIINAYNLAIDIQKMTTDMSVIEQEESTEEVDTDVDESDIQEPIDVEDIEIQREETPDRETDDEV